MPKINQLSPHVADLIAAGEVVERPGSVVKELLENAIDAGAQHITVEIKDGGMTFIRLCDDGCGMAPEDARIAFLRHATSKIKDAADLAAIQTLGFRGEALAAISSVSKIDLLTRTADAPAGTSLHLEAGKITRQDEAGCPPGTTIIVRDLFYNTPARMKFMKSDAAEGAFIFAAVQKQALAHPALSICFIRDGQELLRTPGDGQLHSAIYSVWGRELAGGMLPVHSMWENMQLDGFVTKPTVTRGNRNYEAFFVNGRYIKSRLLSAALEDAYQNQIMVGRMPGLCAAPAASAPSSGRQCPSCKNGGPLFIRAGCQRLHPLRRFGDAEPGAGPGGDASAPGSTYGAGTAQARRQRKACRAPARLPDDVRRGVSRPFQRAGADAVRRPGPACPAGLCGAGRELCAPVQPDPAPGHAGGPGSAPRCSAAPRSPVCTNRETGRCTSRRSGCQTGPCPGTRSGRTGGAAGAAHHGYPSGLPRRRRGAAHLYHR